MKNILSIFFCFTLVLGQSQIDGVDYLMNYNCETNKYDVSIVILEGSAMDIPDRVQLNSQISIVVPTGEAILITDKYMPLQGNQNYTGTAPLEWSLTTPIISPDAQPENDFYSIFPKLSPASFYNDLEEGDIVKLFSFTAGSTGQYDEGVRFYNNGVDPGDSDPGMAGGDFSNGFTIGSAENIYNGHTEENCSITNVEELSVEEELKTYPNPFQNQITIELKKDKTKVSVLGSDGKIYYESDTMSKGILRINTYQYPEGVYYIRTENVHGNTMQKVVKFF